MPHITIDTCDATELAELLQLLHDWLASDPSPTSSSLTHFIGHQAYDLPHLLTDLDRFTFLLGANDGEPLFNPKPQTP